jgi:hypothetical protein
VPATRNPCRVSRRGSRAGARRDEGAYRAYVTEEQRSPCARDQAKPGTDFGSQALALATLVAASVAGSLACGSPRGHAGILDAAAVVSATAKRDSDIAILRQRIVEVCALSPLTVEAAVDALGLRRGPARAGGPVNWEWGLEGSHLVVDAVAGVTAGTPYVELLPVRALDMSFEDLVSAFLDSPYYMHSQEGHFGEDSVANVVTGNYHIFRVKAGELKIYVPTPPSDRTPQRTREAYEDGYATAMGTNPRRESLTTVLISGERRISDWLMDRTLRELRDRHKRRSAPSSAKRGSSAATTKPAPAERPNGMKDTPGGQRAR